MSSITRGSIILFTNEHSLFAITVNPASHEFFVMAKALCAAASRGLCAPWSRSASTTKLTNRHPSGIRVATSIKRWPVSVSTAVLLMGALSWRCSRASRVYALATPTRQSISVFTTSRCRSIYTVCRAASSSPSTTTHTRRSCHTEVGRTDSKVEEIQKQEKSCHFSAQLVGRRWHNAQAPRRRVPVWPTLKFPWVPTARSRPLLQAGLACAASVTTVVITLSVHGRFATFHRWERLGGKKIQTEDEAPKARSVGVSVGITELLLDPTCGNSGNEVMTMDMAMVPDDKRCG